MVTPINLSTDGGFSVEIKTFYKKGLIKFAEKATVFNQFGQSATISRNQGKTWEWRRPSQLTKITGAAAVLTEGTTPTGSALTFANITASPLQYGDYFAGSDVIDATIYDPLRTYVVEAQAYQMAQIVDNLIQIGVLAGSTNHQYSSVSGTRTATNQITTADILTETEIRKAIRTLKRNAARPLDGGKFAAVIHPDTWFTLTQDPDIREAIIYAKGGGGSLFTGELGEYMGVRWVESPLAPVNATGGSGGIAVYSTVFFGMDYFGKVDISGLTTDSIFHDVGSAGAADPLNQRWTQGWKLTFVAKILNEAYAVVVEHAVA
jgi:N4-gp56 family major capsid protein